MALNRHKGYCLHSYLGSNEGCYCVHLLSDSITKGFNSNMNLFDFNKQTSAELYSAALLIDMTLLNGLVW